MMCSPAPLRVLRRAADRGDATVRRARPWTAAAVRALNAALLVAAGRGAASAQQLSRPANNWGDVPMEQPAPLFGGAEVLTALLVSLLLLAGYSLWQLWRIVALRRLLSRATGRLVVPVEPVALAELLDDLDSWAPLLPWLSLGLPPLLGLVTMVLGRGQHVLGVDIPLLALGAAATAAVLGALARILVVDLQRRALPD